jgi:tRNA A-37 threonylcarbamoyl transferase component Bud32
VTTSSTSAPLLGAVLADRYELVRLIARGGMGDVYEAQDRLLRRQVAVKVYRADALADRSRFDAEVHTLAALNHPGLVQVFDAGEHDGDGYVVLELVDGPTLRSMLADHETLSSTEVAALGEAVAAALAYVHGAGVVHRDVTPSNILCGSDGRPRLADFGIARLLDTSRITAVATTIGTAAYMAPEQVEGRDVTPAADVYALGLVLIEALTGRTAFAGVGHEVALARLARDPDVETDVPTEWHALLAAMTARDPGSRPTAAVVSAHLTELAGGVAASAITDPTDAPTAPVAVIAGVAAAGAVGADAAADSAALTQATALGGGTTVMPAALQPEPEVAPLAASAAVGAAGADGAVRGWGWPRRRLWVALAVIAAVLLAALASGNDIGVKGPTPTTQPVVVTAPTTLPTTTAPPQTQPPRPAKGKGHGKGG